MAESSANPRSQSVCFGDYISLKAVAPSEGYMHAQALILTRLGTLLTRDSSGLHGRIDEKLCALPGHRVLNSRRPRENCKISHHVVSAGNEAGGERQRSVL